VEDGGLAKLNREAARKALISSAVDPTILGRDGFPDASKMIAKAKKEAAMRRANPRKGDERERGQDLRKPTTTMRQAIGPDEAFEKLAGQLIESADKVPCSLDDYIAGLRYILGEVEVAIQAAKETQG
jgi:hypothetical protein